VIVKRATGKTKIKVTEALGKSDKDALAERKTTRNRRKPTTYNKGGEKKREKIQKEKTRDAGERNLHLGVGRNAGSTKTLRSSDKTPEEKEPRSGEGGEKIKLEPSK